MRLSKEGGVRYLLEFGLESQDSLFMRTIHFQIPFQLVTKFFGDVESDVIRLLVAKQAL